jgi:cytochrome c oxidase cbb3-type subunit 3
MFRREIAPVGLLCVLVLCPLAQDKDRPQEINNPFGKDKAAIAAGRERYESACDVTDKKMFDTIKQGVQGTPMPPFSLPDSQIWQLVSFVRNLNATAIDQDASGDSATGETLFFGTASCSMCHMIRGRGGLLGPDLSDIASTRSLDAIQESIKAPSALIEPGYAGVSVVTLNDQRVSGILKNESNYSIQIQDAEGNLHLFLKGDLKELVRRRKSLMPTPSLSERELEDLLAFLSRQSLDLPAQKDRKTTHGKQVDP